MESANQLLFNSVLNNCPWDVERALQQGGNINMVVNNRTLLHHAIDGSKYRVAEILLKNGINVNCLGNIMDSYRQLDADFTPLQFAVWYMDFKFVRLLLQYGADPNIYCSTGLATIHIAVQTGNIQNVRYIAMANIDSIDIPATNADYQGWTALHFAIHLKRYDVVSFLVDNGADIIAKASEGVTPLHLIQDIYMLKAVFYNSHFKDLNTVLTSISNRGFNFNSTYRSKSLFLMAHEFQWNEGIEIMKRLGAEIVDNYDWHSTVLHLNLSNMSL